MISRLRGDKSGHVYKWFHVVLTRGELQHNNLSQMHVKTVVKGNPSKGQNERNTLDYPLCQD